MTGKFRSVCQHNTEHFPEGGALVAEDDFTVWKTEDQYTDFCGSYRIEYGKKCHCCIRKSRIRIQTGSTERADMVPERSAGM